jgi:hypothetical protein
VTPKTRDSTVQDIDRIESLTLEDFDVNFDSVTVPDKGEGERLTREELDVAVNGFLAAFER